MVNEWTRKDVPGAVQVLASWDTAPGDGYPLLASHTLDAVVEHLNAHHPKPRSVEQFMREVNTPDPEKVALDEARIKANIERNEARRETDRWRRAHSIVEQERDTAREQRDEWKARAEAAEASAAPAVSRADVAESLSRCLNPEMFNLTFPAVVKEICDLFGVESEQATDPVEEKAREFAALIDWAINDREEELLHTVAKHVIEQEASDGR